VVVRCCEAPRKAAQLDIFRRHLAVMELSS